MSDQPVRLSGDGPAQSSDASLGSGLLAGAGFGVQLLAGARYEIGEPWSATVGVGWRF